MIGFFKLKYSDLNQEKNSVDDVIIKGSQPVKVNILKFLYTKMKQSISQRRLQVLGKFKGGLIPELRTKFCDESKLRNYSSRN